MGYKRGFPKRRNRNLGEGPKTSSSMPLKPSKIGGTKTEKILIKKVVSTLKSLWKIVKQIFGKIQKIAKKVWGIVKDIVIDVVVAIRDFWEKNGAQIWATVKTLFTNIWNIASTAFDIIYNAVLKFLDYVRPIWENIKQLFSSLWDTLVELYETLKPVFDLIGGLVTDFARCGYRRSERNN